MISIRTALTDLDQVWARLGTTLECYRGLVADVIRYSLNLDDDLGAPLRSQITELADRVKTAAPAEIPAYDLAVRSFIRDHWERVNEYVGQVREEQAQTERALAELTAVLSQVDDDHDGKIRSTVDHLRTISRSPKALAFREALQAAAGAIEESVEQIRREHQAAIGQFHKEIRGLQRRIGPSEAETAIENLTTVFTRAEMIGKLQARDAADYLIALIRVRGLRGISTELHPAVAGKLIDALIKRLRGVLPGGSLVARWGEDQFVGAALREQLGGQSISLCRSLAERLGGVYAFTDEEELVRPSIEVAVCTVDAAPHELPEQTVDRIHMAFLRI